MRAAAYAIAMALGVNVVDVTAAIAEPARQAGVQQPAGLETLVEPVQYWGSSICERLRRACVYKEYRDEVGDGNCRRYRNECLDGNSYCERLRRACVYKDYRDEVGDGNCRRYRRECSGY